MRKTIDELDAVNKEYRKFMDIQPLEPGQTKGPIDWKKQSPSSGKEKKAKQHFLDLIQELGDCPATEIAHHTHLRIKMSSANR